MKKDCFRNTITISKTIFFYQIQLLWNPHFRAPVCFCDIPLQPAAFGILPERNVPFKRIFPDFRFVDRKYIFLTRPFYCGQKMCPDADCADIVCNFPLLYVQRYAPVHGPQRVRIHPLGRRNVLAARQNCRCARLRILEKFLQRFHDFHLSPVHTADRIAEAVHLIAVV